MNPSPSRPGVAGLRISAERARSRQWRPRCVVALLSLLALVLSSWGVWTQRVAGAPASAVAATAPGREEPHPTAAREGAPVPSRTGILDASGYLAARRRAQIGSPIFGRVVEVPVEVGQRVDAGALLTQIDDAIPRAQWEKARAEVMAARRALRVAEIRDAEATREWSRRRALGARGVASRVDLERAKAEREVRAARTASLRATLRAAERGASVWEGEVARHQIRAPFSGVVVARSVEVGEVVGPELRRDRFARDGILTLADPDSVEIEVEINEAQIAQISPGGEARVVLDAYPDDEFIAHVHEIVPAANRQRASVRVWLRLDEKDPRFWPELSARVHFRAGPER